jgi:transposase
MRHAAAFVPMPDERVLLHVAIEGGRLIVVAAARRADAHCRGCGTATSRLLGRYERCLADLPWHGLAVTLRVQVRRFVCEQPTCPRRIFCEQLPATAATTHGARHDSATRSS